MSIVNTNVGSLIAQRNFGKSSTNVATAMERLSSGMRINSAKDDAAGQAIANRLTAQIRGLSQAQRNANDGISLAQTAEGALGEINENVQRMRELTVQAKNETNNVDDLRSIQGEIIQRLGEIDRISDQTDFNGTKVLAADSTMNIQVGAEDGQQIPIKLPLINTKTLDIRDFSVATFPEVTAVQLQSAFGAELQMTVFEQQLGAGGTTTYSIDAASGVVTNEAGNPLNVAIDGTLTENSTETNFPITANDILATNSGWSVATIVNPEATLGYVMSVMIEGDIVDFTAGGKVFANGDGNFRSEAVDNNHAPGWFKGETVVIEIEGADTEISFDDSGVITTIGGSPADTNNTLLRIGGTFSVGTRDSGSANIDQASDMIDSNVDPFEARNGDYIYSFNGLNETVIIYTLEMVRDEIRSFDNDLFLGSDTHYIYKSNWPLTGELTGSIYDTSSGLKVYVDDNGEFTTNSSSGDDANGNGSYTTTVDGTLYTATISGSIAPDGTDGSLSIVDDLGAAANLYVASDGSTWTEEVVTLEAAELEDVEALENTALASQHFSIPEGEFAGDYTADGMGQITREPEGEVMYLSANANGEPVLVTESDGTMAQLDTALQMIDSFRSELGAVQNRFMDVITNISTNQISLSAARSRIEDADYAVEVANMTKAQILQQASNSMMAQANQIPQNVLSLLE